MVVLFGMKTTLLDSGQSRRPKFTVTGLLGVPTTKNSHFNTVPCIQSPNAYATLLLAVHPILHKEMTTRMTFNFNNTGVEDNQYRPRKLARVGYKKGTLLLERLRSLDGGLWIGISSFFVLCWYALIDFGSLFDNTTSLTWSVSVPTPHKYGWSTNYVFELFSLSNFSQPNIHSFTQTTFKWSRSNFHVLPKQTQWHHGCDLWQMLFL